MRGVREAGKQTLKQTVVNQTVIQRERQTEINRIKQAERQPDKQTEGSEKGGRMVIWKGKSL